MLKAVRNRYIEFRCSTISAPVNVEQRLKGRGPTLMVCPSIVVLYYETQIVSQWYQMKKHDLWIKNNNDCAQNDSLQCKKCFSQSNTSAAHSSLVPTTLMKEMDCWTFLLVLPIKVNWILNGPLSTRTFFYSNSILLQTAEETSLEEFEDDLIQDNSYLLT